MFKLPPLSVNDKLNSCEIMPWNRKYTMGDAPFFSSIFTNGQEILSSPMRLVGIENGNELVVSDVNNCMMYGATDDEVCACQFMQSKRFVFNTTLSVERDGMVDCFLTVSSQGRSVAQQFGLCEPDNGDRILERLWLEIPIKKSMACSYQFAPSGKALIDGEEPQVSPAFYSLGAMPKQSLKLGFINQLFVSNDEVGFAVLFETDKHWQYDDEQNVVECVVKDDEVIIRVHLLDSEPHSWLNKGLSNGLDLVPISFRIAMQVTPVKAFPANPYTEKNMHIDCFKKILEPYEQFLFSPFGESDEIALDRMKRLGVNTLYIHEKWNDIQNSPMLTEPTARRLRLIIDEAHKRGMKVIPYFGYEMSTMSPMFAEKADEWLISNIHWHWYRYPWQRAIRVCYCSEWKDVFCDYIEKLMDQFDFDGLYIDSVDTSYMCSNGAHGCGYTDENGKRKGTYPMYSVRKMMKRLSSIVEKKGGEICLHSCATFPVALASSIHKFWEGETLQTELMKGNLTRVPMDYYRASYTGRNIGVPVNMICYSNPPAWTFDEALSNALVFGILPKPIDTGYPLERMSKLWDIFNDFPLENARWVFYPRSEIKLSEEDVKLSYYETDKEMLCLSANTVKQDCKSVTVKLPFVAKRIKDCVTDEVLVQNSDEFTIDYGSFDYKILRIVK